MRPPVYLRVTHDWVCIICSVVCVLVLRDGVRAQVGAARDLDCAVCDDGLEADACHCEEWACEAIQGVIKRRGAANKVQ